MINLIKKLSAFACSAVLAGTMLCFSAAASDTQKVICLDGSLDDSKVMEYNDKLEDISDEVGMDVAVLFTDNYGSDIESYAESYTTSNYDTDGIIMVVCYDDSSIDITSFGDVGQDYYNQSRCDNIRESVGSYLHNGDSTGAIDKYAEMCVNYFDDGKSSGFHGSFVVGIIAAVLFAVITVFGIYRIYRFHPKPSTTNYLEGGDLDYHIKNDTFITSHTSRVKIESDSSSGHSGGSSGGSSHTSSSGHF